MQYEQPQCNPPKLPLDPLLRTQEQTSNVQKQPYIIYVLYIICINGTEIQWPNVQFINKNIKYLFIDKIECDLFTLPSLFFVEGKKHDSGMLAQSGLLYNLEQYAYNTAGDAMCIYGDPAYPLRVHLQGPYRNAVMTKDMQAYNTLMSGVRVPVEWLFGDIINSHKFVDFKKNLKIGLSSVGKVYVICALFRNGLTCLYGNNTVDFFNLDPPTLQEYFS